MPLFQAATQGLGWQVPQDLSLATFDPHTTVAGIHITTMHPPRSECGKQAVEMILKKIQDPITPIPRRVLAWQPQEGDSIAPPPPAS